MPAEVMNPVEEDVILHKNTHIGILSWLPSQETICSLEEGSPGSAKEVTSELAMEQEDLLNKIEIDVDQEETSQITQLIKNHEDVFFLRWYPLGHTDLVKHDAVILSQDSYQTAHEKTTFSLEEYGWRESTENAERWHNSVFWFTFGISCHPSQEKGWFHTVLHRL